MLTWILRKACLASMILPAGLGSVWREWFSFCWYRGVYLGLGLYLNTRICPGWRSNPFIFSHTPWITTSQTYLSVSWSCSVVTNCEIGGQSIEFSPELSVGELSCSMGQSLTTLHLPPISALWSLRSCVNHFAVLPHRQRHIVLGRNWMRWDGSSDLRLTNALLIWRWWCVHS